MKYTQIPQNTFKNLQLNAGIIVSSFNPTNGEVDGIVGATTGGISFNASPEYSDFGEDIDNCPKNTKELKKLTDWGVTMTGTFVSVTKDLAKQLVAVGDVDAEDETHIIPRSDLLLTDFTDIWFVGDYSDVNTGASAGFLAIHLFNALSTGGFSIQTGDKAKGNFAFEFTGHFSLDAQDTVPFEIYVKEGQSSPITPTGIGVSPSEITLDVDEELSLIATLSPKGATGEITYESSDTSVATVDTNGKVKAKATGTATITATCGTYTDTCSVTVVQGA